MSISTKRDNTTPRRFCGTLHPPTDRTITSGPGRDLPLYLLQHETDLVMLHKNNVRNVEQSKTMGVTEFDCRDKNREQGKQG